MIVKVKGSDCESAKLCNPTKRNPESMKSEQSGKRHEATRQRQMDHPKNSRKIGGVLPDFRSYGEQ